MTNSLSEAKKSSTLDAFSKQAVMATMGARVADISWGRMTVEMPFNPEFTQQDGFLHAGIVTTLVDTAAGFAAYTTMPEGKRVLAVEFKMNFMRPAVGQMFVADATVIKPGRQLTVVTGTVYAINNGEKKEIALNQCTMIAVDE